MAKMAQLRDLRRDDPSFVPDASLPVAEDDPLLCGRPLPHRAVFYPLGFAVQIATNNRTILDAARESWGGFRQRHARPMLQYNVLVTEEGTAECPPAPVSRAQGHLLSSVADAHNHIVCDLQAGFAFACLSRGTLRDRSYLRYCMIESPVLTLICSSYATPIHAACVSRHGRGILLCGDSCAGKSSLAYACARAGWVFTTDDASYLLHGATEPRVLGNSRKMRFRPSAQELFPELHGLGITPRAQGKPSIEVPTSNMAGIATTDEAAVHCIVHLNRQPSADSNLDAELLPLDSAFALRRLHQSSYPAEIEQRHSAAIERLSTIEFYELRYHDLQRAVDRLDLLALGVRTPVP